MDKKELGLRIKRLRESRDMSRNALANKAGVSPTYIYQLEKGEKSRPLNIWNTSALRSIHHLKNFSTINNPQAQMVSILFPMSNFRF